MLGLVVGTILVAVVAVVIAIPLGVCAALFITEYAPPRLRKVLQSLIDLLAAVPSILFGLGAVGLATEPRGFLAQVDAGLAILRERVRGGRTAPARGPVLPLAEREESWAAK